MNISKLDQYMDDKIYTRGLKYFKEDRIIDAYFDSNKHRIVGSVIGTNIYDSIFNFDQNNQLKSVSCNCPYFKEEKNVCKHLAALYFFLKDGNLENITNTNYIKQPTKIFKKKPRKNMDTIFLNDYITLHNRSTKIPLKTYYKINYRPYDYYNFAELSLKIGTDRLYVVKDFLELLKAINDNSSLFFGKMFTFDPNIHKFREYDKRIFDFFNDLYSAQKLISMSSHFAPDKIITNKGIRLNKRLFIRLLRLLNDIPFELKLEEEKIDNVTTIFNDTPFNLSIDELNNETVTRINSNKPYKVLSNDEDIIIYSDNNLYIIDKDNKLYPFIKYSLDYNEKTLEISKDKEDKFVSLFANIKNENNVYLSKKIQDRYIKEDLLTSLYLDKFKSGITVEIKFNYGDHSINPFTNEKVNPYIMRDYESEQKVHSIFESSNFIVSNGRLYLSNANKVFDFFKYTLPKLQELCEIYYTDSVKNYYTPKLLNTTTKVNSLQNGNLFDISFDIEGFNKDEVYAILQSIKEKKRFHKLKDNKLIDLEGETPNELRNFLDNIDISEINGNTISLEKYRAVSVFNELEKDNEYLNIKNGEEIFTIINTIKNFNSDNIVSPSIFDTIFRDYQKTGFKWLKTLAKIEFGGILADDMGLGKTLQAIAFMYDIKDSGTSLVVAPSSLIYNWQEEFKKFAPDIKTLVIAGSKDKRIEMFEKLNDYDIIITSYPLIRRDIEIYENYNFICCIIDEAQHIKNPASLNSKYVKSIKSKYRFALTGTPIENSLTELWSIFDFIMPGFLLSLKNFSDKFEKPIVKDNNKKQLKKLTKTISPFILRRKKADVLKELPEKIESKLICDLTKSQRDIYNAYIFKMREDINKKISEEGFQKSKFEILSYITRLRQICCHPSVFIEDFKGKSGKLELLIELLDELVESKHKILLFSQFTSLLNIIRKELDKHGITYNYLDGQTKVSKRMDLVTEFNNSDKDVFLISLKAGGTGLNLTSADTVIHFDPWWNPAVEDQATDRAHRIGQKNSVNVYKLIAKDTIEERIYELQLRKKELIDSVIKKGENFITTLNEGDIRRLFEM